jgi:glycosyltransferase involved in cell wall biosynthesis
MARLGLYEPSTHEHNLYYLVRIATAVGHDVTVFTDGDTAESIREMLDKPTLITWVTRADGERLGHFLHRIEQQYSTDLDLLIVQSLYPSTRQIPTYLRFDPDCDRLLWIYNVNQWFKSSLSLRRGFIWNCNTVGRKLLLRKFDGFCVQYPPMAEYMQDNVGTSKPVYSFPTTLFENEPDRSTAPVRFAVPGYIQSRRRDYDLVLDVFKELFAEHGEKIALELVGTADTEYGKRILDRCRDLQDEGHNVIYYEDWIPKEDYDEAIRTSSFLLCPLRRTIDYRGIKEVYGRTKGSGNVFDSLRNGNPIILPDYFEIDLTIRERALTYEDSKDLLSKLNEIIKDEEKRRRLFQQAHENSAQYSLSRQCMRFDQIVSDYTDS